MDLTQDSKREVRDADLEILVMELLFCFAIHCCCRFDCNVLFAVGGLTQSNIPLSIKFELILRFGIGFVVVVVVGILEEAGNKLEPPDLE